MSVPPPKQLRKIEELRVTRKSNAHVQMHGGEGWAVSYADMLMVLLSFFVMFFSLKEESPQTFDDQLKKISLSMRKLSKGQAEESKGAENRQPQSIGATTAHGAAGATAAGATAAAAAAAASKFPNLSEALKISGVTVTDEKSQLVMTLDDTEFSSAGYRAGAGLLSKVDLIVERLKPFGDQIQVTIVGHTDARRLIPRNEFLMDNFDLSSMRALGILKHVIARGFPENRASARAASSFDRAARSVSIVIQQLNEPKTETGV